MHFDFGADEEKAQEARHKLDVWKQAFRLDKKLQYKIDRPEETAEDEESAEDDEKSKTGARGARPKLRNPARLQRIADGQRESASASVFLQPRKIVRSNAGSIASPRRSPSKELRRRFSSGRTRLRRGGEAICRPELTAAVLGRDGVVIRL